MPGSAWGKDRRPPDTARLGVRVAGEKDEVIWLEVRGPLGTATAVQLEELVPVVGPGRLLVVHLADLEIDTPGLEVLRGMLAQHSHIACVLPPAWTAAGRLLRSIPGAFPCYERTADLRAVGDISIRPAIERRRDPRSPTSLAATLRLRGRSYPGRTTDLSAAGARVELSAREIPTPLHQLLGRVVSLDLPQTPLVARAVRLEAVGESKAVGLRFTGLLPGIRLAALAASGAPAL